MAEADPAPSRRSLLARWLARGVLFTAPAIPVYLALTLIGPVTLPLLVLVVAVPGLILALARRAPALGRGLEGLQLGLSWLGVAALAVFWLRIFPELLLLLLPLVLAFPPRLRERPAVSVVGVALAGAAVLALGYGAPWRWVAVSFAGVLLAWVPARALSPRSRVFAAVTTGLVGFQTTGGLLSFLVYVGEEPLARADVVGQEGLAWALPANAELHEGDLPQLSSFVRSARGVLLLPRHGEYVLRIDGRGRLERTPILGMPTTNLALDVPNQGFHFVAGNYLYRGSLDTLEVERVATLDSIVLRNHSSANFLRSRPGRPSELLVVFDQIGAIVLYDLDSGRQRKLDLPYAIRGGDWHPQGDRLLLYGKDIYFGGHLLLVDLEGNVLRERRMGLTDRVEFARVRPGARSVFAMRFLRGRLERISPDTLETEWTARVAMPRGLVESRSAACVLVASYSRGTLNVLRSRDGELLETLRVGRRVRTVTTAPGRTAHWITSAAGPFVLREDALPSECRAEEVRRGPS